MINDIETVQAGKHYIVYLIDGKRIDGVFDGVLLLNDGKVRLSFITDPEHPDKVIDIKTEEIFEVLGEDDD